MKRRPTGGLAGAWDDAGEDDAGGALAAGLGKGVGRRLVERGAELQSKPRTPLLRQRGPAQESQQAASRRPD